jgi:chaperonin GroEL (HSP60 family)
MVYPGGGVALLYASKDLDKLPTANFDQKIGVQIIQNALKVCKKCRIRLIFFVLMPLPLCKC